MALPLSLKGQTVVKILQVVRITEYTDGFLIKTVDPVGLDTVSLVCSNRSVLLKKKYQKITIGHSYKFEFEDLSKTTGAAPISTLSVRLRKTIVWTGREDPNHMPAFLKNTKGLWILKRDLV